LDVINIAYILFIKSETKRFTF